MNSAGDPDARMCFRKKAMPEEHARKVAARAPGLRAYQCPLCSLWHVTNDFDADGQPKYGRGPLAAPCSEGDD